MISETFKEKICNNRISKNHLLRIIEKELQDNNNAEEVVEFLSEHRPDLAAKILSTIPGF